MAWKNEKVETVVKDLILNIIQINYTVDSPIKPKKSNTVESSPSPFLLAL